MLSKEQSGFVQYWQANRQRYSSFSSKITRGLPFAIVFFVPILLFVGVVYMFFPEWYAKVSDTSASSLLVACIAVFITILFFAYFRMHFKWEMNEQLYNELIYKQERENAAN